MFSREALEKILIINGLEPSAPDEEIRSVLLRAKWNDFEVDTALSILRENKTHEQKVDTIHNIFRTDEKLTPENISALLGVSVDYSHVLAQKDPFNSKRRLTTGTLLQIIAISIVLSGVLALACMYIFEVGLFHPAGTFSFEL